MMRHSEGLLGVLAQYGLDPFRPILVPLAQLTPRAIVVDPFGVNVRRCGFYI